ncbi:hypothetical protein [uncultured Deinococcus sp.]|uniref:hypothetical protein n=1 Tax=uncultured Deinococcus sp. TaxID=158789 RepID=UPI00258E71DA|nr:hypothetical protein [uncultured Deinococcus sp.]
MKFLILLLIVVAIVAFLVLRKRSGTAGPPQESAPQVQPPGTRHLDEETAARPEIDASALSSARARVSQDIPDEVLGDVLLDATPQQAARMFAAVPADVMAGAIGQNTARAGTVQVQGQASAGDMAQLSSLGSAVDDLDFWSLGDDTPSQSQKK